MHKILITALCLTIISCAGPRLVAKTTATKDQMKLLYVQDGEEQGIIRCDIIEEGKLDKCKELVIHFN